MSKASVTRVRKPEGIKAPSSDEGAAAPVPGRLDSSLLDFEPQLVERVWGGTAFQRLSKGLPSEKQVGESWEISDVPGKPSVVAHGPWKSRTLRQLMLAHAEELLGASSAPQHPEGGLQFPLLVKLLDAREDLSVQVHPSDEDLRRGGVVHGSGKTEAWVILEAVPGARIIHGLAPGVDKARLARRLSELKGNRLSAEEEQSFFRYVPVTRGDVIFVPAGTIHAVGGGIVLTEVQQTSDVTYRIYDWGRRAKEGGKARDLHLTEAMGVADAAPLRCPFRKISEVLGSRGFTPLLGASDCDKFQIDVLALGAKTATGSRLLSSTCVGARSAFQILSAFEGEIHIRLRGQSDSVLKPGHFVLLPATAGDYELEARADGQVLRFGSI